MGMCATLSPPPLFFLSLLSLSPSVNCGQLEQTADQHFAQLTVTTVTKVSIKTTINPCEQDHRKVLEDMTHTKTICAAAQAQ